MRMAGFTLAESALLQKLAAGETVQVANDMTERLEEMELIKWGINDRGFDSWILTELGRTEVGA